jgi:hypothetical protein
LRKGIWERVWATLRRLDAGLKTWPPLARMLIALVKFWKSDQESDLARLNARLEDLG